MPLANYFEINLEAWICVSSMRVLFEERWSLSVSPDNQLLAMYPNFNDINLNYFCDATEECH